MAKKARKTREDAYALVSQAWTGSLVGASSRYLRGLREFLHQWLEKVDEALREVDSYEVIVDGVGTAYEGENEDEALEAFHDSVRESRSSRGRVSGKDVTLFVNGEPIEEHRADED